MSLRVSFVVKAVDMHLTPEMSHRPLIEVYIKHMLPLMTQPSVNNDRLMFLASSNRSPVDSVCFVRSL